MDKRNNYDSLDKGFAAFEKETTFSPEATQPSYYIIPEDCNDIGDVVAHLPFWCANAMKYIYRSPFKHSNCLADLYKAQECIEREILRQEEMQRKKEAGLA